MSDRKYRHSGYMDSDDDRKERTTSGPRQQTPRYGNGGPRGRGIGMPTRVAFKCAACGQPHDLVGSLTPDTVCSRCGAPLHTCTNCMFFDSGARFECRKPISERVENKSKANSCEHFQTKTVRDLRSPDSGRTTATGKSAFDALFKK